MFPRGSGFHPWINQEGHGEGLGKEEGSFRAGGREAEAAALGALSRSPHTHLLRHRHGWLISAHCAQVLEMSYSFLLRDAGM